MRDDLIARRCDCLLDEPEQPCGCGQHYTRLFRDDVWHWRGQHWTAACLITAALTAQQGTRAQALADARQGIENATDRRPALMNPDTMRHIAANVELWADHAKFLREPAAQGETAPATITASRPYDPHNHSIAAADAFGETAPAPVDEANRSYYGKALDLLADQLTTLPADEWEGRRMKVVAILRNAAADTAAASSLPAAEGLWRWRSVDDDGPDGAGGQVWVAYPNPHHPAGWNLRVQWTPLQPELASSPAYWCPITPPDLVALRAVAEGRKHGD